MGLRDAYKYEENKRKIKIGKEKIGKRKVRSGYSRSVSVIGSFPVFKRTGTFEKKARTLCEK